MERAVFVKWMARSVCVILATIALGGCIVVPGHGYRPVYYYR